MSEYVANMVRVFRLVKTALASLSSIVVGDRVGAATAGTSGSTTAGRVNLIDTTGATTTLAESIMNFIGYAATARTTNNTDADVLVLLRERY